MGDRSEPRRTENMLQFAEQVDLTGQALSVEDLASRYDVDVTS